MLKSLATKIIKSSSKLIQSNKFRESFIAAAVVLCLSPFSIYLGFRLNTFLSKPMLSIEYVSRYEKEYFNFDKLTLLLRMVINNGIYQEYRSKTWSSANSFDLRMVKNIPSLAQPGDLAKKIKGEIEHYEGYLDSAVKEVEVEIKKLPNISKIDMRILAHQFLDSSSTEKEDKLMVKLRAYFNKKKMEINSTKGVIKKIRENLSDLGKTVDVKLTILNKGSTDGLIRNRGTIYDGENKYRIQRIPPPTAHNALNAVPTFQVNAPPGTFSPQSVGQIIKNTMTELWFRVEEQKTGNTGGVCSKQDQFTVTLYDQDNKPVEREFSCIEEG